MNDKRTEGPQPESELEALRNREIMYLDHIERLKAQLAAQEAQVEALRCGVGWEQEEEVDRPTIEWRRVWARTAGDESQRLIIRGRIDEYIEIEERKIAKAEAALHSEQVRCQKVTVSRRRRSTRCDSSETHSSSKRWRRRIQ